jgi:hypothetical protein
MSNMSNMSDDEAKAVGMWDRTKAWADKNRTISGALVGGAAGTIVPGLGTLIGAIVGAGVGFCLLEGEGQERRALAAARLIPETQRRNGAAVTPRLPQDGRAGGIGHARCSRSLRCLDGKADRNVSPRRARYHAVIGLRQRAIEIALDAVDH